MSIEQQLLEGYEKAVATLVAHASLHAPAEHQSGLRDFIIRGERTVCERCGELRKALLNAAEAWRNSMKRRGKSAEAIADLEAHSSIPHLGLTG